MAQDRENPETLDIRAEAKKPSGIS